MSSSGASSRPAGATAALYVLQAVLSHSQIKPGLAADAVNKSINDMDSCMKALGHTYLHDTFYFPY